MFLRHNPLDLLARLFYRIDDRKRSSFEYFFCHLGRVLIGKTEFRKIDLPVDCKFRRDAFRDNYFLYTCFYLAQIRENGIELPCIEEIPDSGFPESRRDFFSRCFLGVPVGGKPEHCLELRRVNVDSDNALAHNVFRIIPCCYSFD